MIPVAYFIHNLNTGGAERHLLMIFRHLDRRRFRPILFCLGDGRQRTLYEELRSLTVETVNIGFPNRWTSPQALIKTLNTATMLHRRKVRIVHGYLFEGNLIGALAGRMAGIPVVIGSKRSFDHYRRLQRLACRFNTAMVTRVTANSRSVEEFVLRQEPESRGKIVVIPNGIDICPVRNRSAQDRAKWHIPPEAPVVGTVARFFWKKNYPCFLDMAVKVLAKRPDAYFIAIGDGPQLPQMQKKALELGLEDRMVFTGWQKQPEERLLRLFDVYVCTSVIEGMSNAMLEAMAQSLPVVATAVGGNTEVVSRQETGYLVASDDPDALAAAVIELLDDPKRRLSMGKAGRRKVCALFNSREMVHKLESLYEDLLSQKGVS
ncbi:MAG: glycosyltransferase [Deltaproteobacteria bacterium]|nr:glycosyltransferase [Deltaproteobacteria bacterium]